MLVVCQDAVLPHTQTLVEVRVVRLLQGQLVNQNARFEAPHGGEYGPTGSDDVQLGGQGVFT
jgi:hypothetical protein